MSNVAKLKKRALDYEQKKQFDRALETYVQILAELDDHVDEADVALYNRVRRDAVQARAVADAVRAYDASLPMLTLPGSAVHEVADGLTVIAECFADRAYTPSGGLVSRREPGAVIHDEKAVVERAVRMAVDGTVVAVDGSEVALKARSICVHGDTPGAVALARSVRAALSEAGVALEPFA